VATNILTVIAGSMILAKLVDRRIAKRDLRPASVTRYRVLRRSVTAAIVAVGILSALLVIPQIRAVAGAILASGAVIGLVVGFAAQKTLGNFIAGLLIAFSQPLRIGDLVEVDDAEGVVEEIGLTYTFIRLRDDVRLVIPNEKLASDTIRNSTIRSAAKYAEVTVQVPLTADLRSLVEALRNEVDAPGIAERIRRSLEEPFVIGGREYWIRGRTGIPGDPSGRHASGRRRTPARFVRMLVAPEHGRADRRG